MNRIGALGKVTAWLRAFWGEAAVQLTFANSIGTLSGYESCNSLLLVGVAQLVRALGCGPRGRGFESHHSPLSQSRSVENR